MSEQYDVFLSYASEETEWCAMLAERLRNEGVRVWFDKRKFKPSAQSSLSSTEALGQSRKVVAVWTANYLRDGIFRTVDERFHPQKSDALAHERKLIPLLREDGSIPPTLEDCISIDFRNDDDFDLRLRELIQTLDPPRLFEKPTLAEQDEQTPSGLREDKPDEAMRGLLSYRRGKRFEDEVATLYDLLGFEVKRDLEIDGMQIDLVIERDLGGLYIQAIVECKDKRITSKERDQILGQQRVVQQARPACICIAVSSQGFAPDTRVALEKVGIRCITYDELLRELVPLGKYVQDLISGYEVWMSEHWQGKDWFIRPNTQTDVTYVEKPALEHIGKWLGLPRANLLMILGDLGTGKSRLANFLVYVLAKSFLADPLHQPAPVLIPLKEVRKEVSLEGIVINHFSRHGLPGINFTRFNHLVRLGKIILFFDAFDEMADRIRWEVTQSNFRELRRAAEQEGKVIVTCRTHYFKDRNEQVRLIGAGPRLSEIETDLYRELRQQSSAEVIYLQGFNQEQIQSYLRKARPLSAVEDWHMIKEIYNLEDLAQRPLLLDMIVNTLPKLEEGKKIDAASLYRVFTELWIAREYEQKERSILSRESRLALMLELAWRMWHENRGRFPYLDLVPFIEELVSESVLKFDDEQAQDVANEMQIATFLKRDDSGNFTFMHQSFLAYFLALKIFKGVVNPDHKEGVQNVLNTRRFNWEVIYFLTLLDKSDDIRAPLQNILSNAYIPNVSENALEILYWSSRVRCEMEKEISDEKGD